MCKSFLCLLLFCHYVLNFEIQRDSGDSGEVSDESLESLEINPEVAESVSGAAKCRSLTTPLQADSCLVEVCTDQCYRTESNNNGQTEKNVCNFGCKFMINVFNNVKTKFSKTEPEFLLGNALDECWQGCVDNYSGAVFCYSGCNVMRNLKKQDIKIRRNKKSEPGGASTQETLPWYIKVKQKEMQENLIQDSDSDIEKIPVVRTYVLWKPNSADLDSVYSSYNAMVSLMQEMFGDQGEQVEGGRGYQDDRRQLSLPKYQGYAALTSEEESQTDKAKEALENLYERMRARFDDVALNIRNTLQSPRYKEMIFYVLMTICCFLILTAIYDIFCENKKQNSEEIEDHYHLEDTAFKAKLPSYEECMLHDPVKQNLAVHLEEEEENEKKRDEIINI